MDTSSPPKKTSDPSDSATLSLILESKQIYRFFQLLQKGFMVEVELGCSTKETLCQQIGVNPEYLEERIKTLFLDGKPVDDVTCAMVTNGATLALSGAMPGLVGAVMRRGGILAPFRSSITHQEEGADLPSGKGMITIKLFNVLIPELGPTFLKQGIYMEKKELELFLHDQPKDFWEGCKKAEAEGAELEITTLPKMDWAGNSDLIKLSVVAED